MMTGNHRQAPAVAPNAAPSSPSGKGTAKYTNKDGSKFIMVPKTSSPTNSSYPSPTTAPSSSANRQSADSQVMASPTTNGPAQPVNRKKQKRRAKAAAKAAAEQALHGGATNGLPSPPASHGHQVAEAEGEESDEEAGQYEDNHAQHPHQNGFPEDASTKKKSKKKKKKGGASAAPDNQNRLRPSSQAPLPPLSQMSQSRGSGISKEKIWNTSSQEERERIKEFWLGLGEDERKSLVKVEKDAVLRKMKEQQKLTCSCTVCGRKRTAIEEELEGLYDAYYQELEQFANHPQGEPPLMGRPFSSMGGVQSRELPSNYASHKPSRGRIVEQLEDEEDDVEEEGDEEYSDDDLDEDEYSDEPSEVSHRNDYASDFFNFGNSLTVQGGILTVADDLLKNDGKKFIEMMEQLAERRMAREEDAKEQFERSYGHPNGDRYGHNHPPPDDEDYDEEEGDYEEDDDEDYESQEEEETMTEEQRMEEGRRMFQIFAARMFEQRVLTAYREKVAKERQQKLIEELEAEQEADVLKAAKRAKEAEKRKNKAAKKKAQQAEEKARREEQEAAEEAARRAEEARKAEENRAKAEDKRKKREAQKKAEEEERLRKEAERQRRLHEQREKQAEAERKAREREREKKAREEARQKEKEARERKEREARERKEKEARERKEQAEREKREKEAKEKAERAEREAREKKKKQEERAAQKAAALANAGPPITLAKRPAPHAIPAAVPAIPQQPAAFASPQIAVATPALPKAPLMRQRQESQHEAPIGLGQVRRSSSSVANQNHSPHPATPVRMSPGPIGLPSKAGSSSAQSGPQISSQATSPLNAAAKIFSAAPTTFPMQNMGMPFPPGIPQPPPGLGNRMPHDAFPPVDARFRPGPPGMMSLPPGLNGPVGGGRGFPMPHAGGPPPGFGFPQPMESPLTGAAQVFVPGGPPKEAPVHNHSRQPSSSFEPSTPAPSLPIGRPAPIGRPGSVVQGQRVQPGGSPAPPSRSLDIEDHHLGSSALLDDSDEAFSDFPTKPRRGNAAPGPRQPPAFPYGLDPIFPPHHNPWGGSVGAAFAPGPPPGLGPMPGSWGTPGPNTAFGGQIGMGRPAEPRSVAVRKMLCRACEDLAAEFSDLKLKGSSNEFIPLEAVKAKIDQVNQGNPVSEKELMDICETEGNDSNGGGSFDVQQESGQMRIRYVMGNSLAGAHPLMHRAVGAPGEIGSPVIGGPVTLGSASFSGR